MSDWKALENNLTTNLTGNVVNEAKKKEKAKTEPLSVLFD